MKKYIVLLALIVSVFQFVGCEDRTDLSLPSAPAISTGNVDFTTFASLGNSITAGYQSSALYQSAQDYSYGNQLAKLVNATYEIPYVSDPGLGGKISLLKLDASTNPPTPILVVDMTNSGQPTNTALTRPYNNLGIPGAILYDLLDTVSTFASKAAAPRNNPFFQLVLRNPALGASSYTQARSLKPTVLTLWIGNNDVLGYATTGGTSGTDATGKLPTDASVFDFLYKSLINKIATELPNTKVVVANIPNVSAIPFFTTVGPSVAAKLSAAGLPGVYYQKASSVSVALVSDLNTFKVMLTLKSSNYLAYLGKPSGLFYRDNKYPALPAGIDTTKAFGADPANPIPNALVLDADEQVLVNNAVTNFNNSIAAAVAGKANFALVNINSVFSSIRANDLKGTVYGTLTFRTSFLTGGLFSLDGVHPSNQGHTIIANEFIKAINAKWGTNIPQLNVNSVPTGLNLAKSIQVDKFGLPQFPKGAFDNLLF
ncbi:MAG: hypothetical protein LWX56_02910 [Ignavibacteria bacterium]|nr:hypothetical protein [Ignavibacteria bacterium]